MAHSFLRSDCRGQSLLEFSLIMPILMVLIFGIVDFGMALRSYISVSSATREGARFASVGNPPGSFPTDCDGATATTVVGRVCVTLEGLDLDRVQTVGVSYPGGELPGNEVIVSTEYEYDFITPVGDIISFFSGGSFPSTLDLVAETTMRLE